MAGAHDDDVPDLIGNLDEASNNDANVPASGVEENDAADATDDDEDEKSSPSAISSGDVSIRLL